MSNSTKGALTIVVAILSLWGFVWIVAGLSLKVALVALGSAVGFSLFAGALISGIIMIMEDY